MSDSLSTFLGSAVSTLPKVVLDINTLFGFIPDILGMVEAIRNLPCPLKGRFTPIFWSEESGSNTIYSIGEDIK